MKQWPEIQTKLQDLEAMRTLVDIQTFRINQSHERLTQRPIGAKSSKKLVALYTQSLQVLKQQDELLSDILAQVIVLEQPEPVEVEVILQGLVAARTPQDWILANILGFLKDKQRYQVQDHEPDDQGIKKKYLLAAHQIIPIAAATTVFDTVVLALYPGTTCFYRAQVLGFKDGYYYVKFEDDAGFERRIESRFCLEYPEA